MSLQRRNARNQVKKEWKEYNKSLKKKDRVSFTTFWRSYLDQKNK